MMEAREGESRADRIMRRFHRTLRDVGVALLALAAGTSIDRLLSTDPTWPWYLSVALGAGSAVAMVLIGVAVHGERNERRVKQAEADTLQAEVKRQSIAANLYLRSHAR